MANERREQDQDQVKDQTPEVTELEDKDLEDASGGVAGAEEATAGNFNCIC